MQLKKIKLAGFKSFVDPTTVLLPSSLVAIVGPNGCGKSNIIDAVCWVMGESSAKHLRGELLTDVIFNGSSARKPIGQAHVELIFDNQDGSLTGEYASYSEISIRRVIGRDAESAYYLNGTRCRRRDIIDIFLGTGIGPRSYSIIGQNMISRIIEAKPEEIRVYLEEAAGVSKFKERRRETENRIQHTKENLARLTDIRLELEKQLSNLKRQANAAEKYKTLKQEERRLRAECYTLQWSELDKELVQWTLSIQQQETGYQEKQRELTQLQTEFEKKRLDQHTVQDTLQAVQRRYYAVGSDITRVEQELKHLQERQIQWQQDVNTVAKEWSDLNAEIEELTTELQEMKNEIQQLEPQCEAAQHKIHHAQQQHDQSETQMQQWQTGWDQFNQAYAKTTQTAEVEKTKIEHLEQKIKFMSDRQTKVTQEQGQIDFVQLEQELSALGEQIGASQESYTQKNQELSQTQEKIVTLQSTQKSINKKLEDCKYRLQQYAAEESSLKTLQQTALGQRNQSTTQWLTQQQLHNNQRLGQAIKVDAGWECAVETILGSYLQAVCIHEFADIENALLKFNEGSLTFFVKNNQAETDLSAHAQKLINKVQCEYGLNALLENIYIADNLTEAFALSKTLKAQESVVTADGVWIGPNWLRISHEKNPGQGIFQREQELKKLSETMAVLREEIQITEQEQAHIQTEIKKFEQIRQELQQQLTQAQVSVATQQSQQKMKQANLTDMQKRQEKLQLEIQECIDQIQQLKQQLAQSRNQWQIALTALEEDSGLRNQKIQERDVLRATVQLMRQELHHAKETAHQLEIRLQTNQSQYAVKQQSLQRMQSQLEHVIRRQEDLQKPENKNFPIADIQASLTELLNQRLAIENELSQARDAVETINQILHQLEQQRTSIEQQVSNTRDLLESARLESQGLKIKSENLLQQISETDFQLEVLLKELPQDAVLSTWQAQLEQVIQRITRLGPINLVAIEEYATSLERKEYLDKQNDDLLEGLNTLEQAIGKIDRETRAKFKDTFDQVNTQFQTLFPQIFGGGHASLELMSDNLLDTGVTIMACPPGKRNSTIHLLSGGEKAMTAIAFVFSIFHLNPAPFCLLDEVDAPLDDANINRFCQLVKNMSRKTQFIFISHNKLAIEMADHLLGVTMHEPGVSRLVSVNVEEAIEMATA